MRYASLLPFSALVALGMISVFVYFQIIPPGAELLTLINEVFSEGLYWVIFLIILLESIIYIGFYFPGQFFSVVLVVGANPKPMDIVYLTLSMVAAATLGSFINYSLGRYSNRNEPDDTEPTKLSRLLLAMIHINSLAFFMFSQGANRKSYRVVFLAGLLNLPYYLLLIAGTAILSEQVMAMAENTYLLVSVITIWLVIALYFDLKKYKQEQEDMQTY